jgi:hypothetical protein
MTPAKENRLVLWCPNIGEHPPDCGCRSCDPD